MKPESALSVSAWREFCLDVAESGRVWRQRPGLVTVAIVVAVLACAGSFVPDASFVFGVFAVAMVGFFGAQRLAFEALRSRAPLTSGQLAQATKHYWGRFVRLGMLVTALTMPVCLLAIAFVDVNPAGEVSVSVPMWFTIFGVVYLVVVDVLLTFATVDLTFATDSATKAFGNGRRLLRSTWSQTKFHALLPPLLPLALGQMVAGTSAAAGAAVIIVGAIIAVVARGAHTIAYLRYRPIRSAALPPSVRPAFRDHPGPDNETKVSIETDPVDVRDLIPHEPNLHQINANWAERGD
ncbi:MAG TPA: hypothetical protein VMM60_06440 [Ilumatobacter sp.]|nr:hypothetical protein [Ilumatobacter sp.]